MNICGGKIQTRDGGVRMMETWRPDRPQRCPWWGGAYLRINKEKAIYTDVPKIHGKQLADIPVSEKSVVLGLRKVWLNTGWRRRETSSTQKLRKENKVRTGKWCVPGDMCSGGDL